MSTLGELKSPPDGQAVLVAAFTACPNGPPTPTSCVDLATGEEEAVTDRRRLRRGHQLVPRPGLVRRGERTRAGLFETVSQVRRPNFIGAGLEPLTAYLFAHHRRELLEPWLVRVGVEQNGDRGQQLNPRSLDDGFDGRTLMTWHPTGDRIPVLGRPGDPFGPPTAASRIVVAHLTDRHPADPEPASPSP